MARVTHVKRAQQRYATKPVIDPATGQQKVVPVLRKDGSQKTTKRGRPVFLKLTERDLSIPLPMPSCGKCGVTIEVGQPYKWIEPHGRGQLVRCDSCPTWKVWEYSSSLSARIAQVQDEGPDGGSFSSLEDATSWAESKASEIRELAEEKRESANNIEEGFGHETYQSAELNETADSLEQWADDLENADLPDFPEPEEDNCDECGGTGTVPGDNEEDEECTECGGTGQVTPDEPSEEQVSEWQAEVQSILEDLLNESPV